MLVRQPEGHALSQTAALADGATDAFSAVALLFESVTLFIVTKRRLGLHVFFLRRKGSRA